MCVPHLALSFHPTLRRSMFLDGELFENDRKDVLRFFMDGEFSMETGVAMPKGGTIFSHNTAGPFFGFLDELRIWPISLTRSTIRKAMMETLRGGGLHENDVGFVPLLYAPFDENSMNPPGFVVVVNKSLVVVPWAVAGVSASAVAEGVGGSKNISFPLSSRGDGLPSPVLVYNTDKPSMPDKPSYLRPTDPTGGAVLCEWLAPIDTGIAK